MKCEELLCLYFSKQEEWNIVHWGNFRFKKRIWQHKNNLVKGFSKKYKVHSLVYFEIFEDIKEAIKREKNIKKWNRKWKLRLIEKKNPNWEDLFKNI